MTITSTVTSVQSPGNGSATIFAAPMKIFAATDPIVGFVIGAVYAQQTSGYSVTNIDINGGFTVTFSTPPPIGTTVDIRTSIAQMQGTEFANFGAYLPENTTDTCDRIVRMVQDLNRQTYDFGIHGPDTESIPWTELPDADSRAGGMLMFDSDGLPTIGVPVTQAVTGPLVLSLLSANSLGTVENPQDSIESAAAVVPTFYTYKTSPKRDVRRYLTAWNDNSDQTAGLQTAINLAYAEKGRLILPNGLNVKSGALSLTMPGNRGNQALAIEGPGWNGAAITQIGSPSALITIVGATPTGNPSEAPLVMEGFTLNGVGNTAVGILLNGVSYWTLRGIQLSSFGAGIKLLSALVGVIDGCQSGNNNYGLLAQRNGAGSGVNSVTVRDSQFNLNSTQGIFIDSGTNWLLENIDCESNGTSTVLATGGIRLGSNLGSEFGASTIHMDTIHLEGNLGQPFIVDSGTTNLNLEITTLEALSGEGNRELLIQSGKSVRISNSISPGALGDIWNISCNALTLEHVSVTTLTDTGVSRPNYIDVTTSASTQALGRVDSFTGTLTAVTGSPTASIGVRQQGDSIWLTVSAGGLLGASSNTTAPTITGLPARYIPTGDRQLNCAVIDNSASKGGVITIGASGVITLVGFGGFTASGSKGLPAITVGPYFL